MKKKIVLTLCSFVIACGGIGMASLPHQDRPASEAFYEAEKEEEPVEAEEPAEEIPEEPAEEVKEEVEVILKTTSMERDLKIKFVDKKSGKIISGADFKAELTSPKKKKKEYSDSDKDGVIWVKNIDGGTYTVAMLDLEGYVTAEKLSAEVKKKLSYEVVDIEDEVKKENEISVPKEDGAYGGGHKDDSTSESGTPEDTVEYVESSKKEVERPTDQQKKDGFGQLMYEKQALDSLGQPMYAKIIAESAEFHKDDNADEICDRCAASMKKEESEKPTEPTEPEQPTEPTEPEQPQEGGEPENTDSGSESAQLRMLMRPFLFLKASSQKPFITYDTSSAPVYDTSSEPVYETETVYIYTGWQNIDGATYYFDKDGNKVTGNQVIQGVSYTFSDEGVRSGTIGIDVSKYQTGIDWKRVKNAGINFVMIRCGYRGYGSGVLVEDPMYASHIKGAKAAGLRVGVYFFSQAINEAEAVEEASMAVGLAKKYGINMPIAIDSEYAAGGAGRADGLSKSARTAVTKAFCNTVRNAGYTPMVYASKSWFDTHLDVSQLSSYRIWVAHYADKCGYKGNYHIWQNTSKGKVDGVPGYVDMNISSI